MIHATPGTRPRNSPTLPKSGTAICNSQRRCSSQVSVGTLTIELAVDGKKVLHFVMDTQNAKPHIAIIGGGIAGLALGIGLSRRNVSYTIYEAAPELNAIGAGITLGPNTTRAMALIDPKLWEGYDKISIKNQSPEKQHNFADFLLAEPGFGSHRGFNGVAVGSKDFVRSGAHRRDLLELMKSLLSSNDSLKFGMRAVNVRHVGQRVKVDFEDGHSVKVDAVVGCDGGKGITRKAVLQDKFPDQVQLAYSGRYVYRGLVPPGEAQRILGDYADDSKIFIDRGRYFAAYPLTNGGFNFLGGRQTNEEWTYAHSTQEVSKDAMVADFEGCDPRLLQLLGVSPNVRSFVTPWKTANIRAQSGLNR